MPNKPQQLKKVINPKEWEFEFQQRNRQSILLADFTRQAAYHELGRALKYPSLHYDYILTGLNKGYANRAQKATALKFMHKHVHDKKYISRILEHAVSEMLPLALFADSVATPERFTPKKLISRWKEFSALLPRVISWWYAPWYLAEENMLTNLVRKALLHHKNKIERITNFENAFMLLIFPTKKALFQEEQDDFFPLVQMFKQSPSIKQSSQFLIKCKKYLTKYAWMKTFPFLPLEPLTHSELIANIKDAASEGQLEEFKIQQQKQKKNAKFAEKILALLKGDARLLAKIADTRKLGWALTAGIEDAFIASARCIPFLKRIAREFNISWENLFYYTSEEIHQGLMDARLPNISDRKIGFVCLSIKGKMKMTYGQGAKKLSEWLDTSLQAVDPTLKELKGKTASPGIARGKVRIALSPKERDALSEGEILVCSMTSPEYVPAMKRSAAIVTDEGGLLSHAAIMSREFGKPCIIATKIGTRFLHTGDLVEVDANRGIVKILKRHRAP